ncbi:SgcJ/EcaC family oxidoreductase [Acidicapsa dinghuensis]|uniref:SgcJ/EcaC family oxidoreductase n=1 Tax=Acidicapsa dinghuensis TaxID=2218256 RepID=A0ABW1EG29_9BACT|nr:SgcJ/EcaC family oxidoreductase [Acidicapsa dinghuensis]
MPTTATQIIDSATDQAVRDTMQHLCEAWEAGDGKAYAALFSEDAQYVTAPGQRLHGREAIATSHQQIFDTIFKNSKLGRNYPVAFHAIAPGVVLLEAAGAVLFPGERESDIPPNGLMTMVLAHRDDAWKIVSFQNTPTGPSRKARFIWRYFRSRMRLYSTPNSPTRSAA